MEGKIKNDLFTTFCMGEIIKGILRKKLGNGSF